MKTETREYTENRGRAEIPSPFLHLEPVAMMVPTLVLPLTATAQENTATNTPTNTMTLTPTDIPTDTPTEMPTDTPSDTPTPISTPTDPPWPTKIHTPTFTHTPTEGPTGTPMCDSGTIGDYLPNTPTIPPTILYYDCLYLANYQGPLNEIPPCLYCYRKIAVDTPVHQSILGPSTQKHHFISDVSASHVFNCDMCIPVVRTVSFTSAEEQWCVSVGWSAGISYIIETSFSFTLQGCWTRPQETVSWDIEVGPCERAKPYDIMFFNRVCYGYKDIDLYEYNPVAYPPCPYPTPCVPPPYPTAIPIIKNVYCDVVDIYDPNVGKGGVFRSSMECVGKCCNWCTPTPMHIPNKPIY